MVDITLYGNLTKDIIFTGFTQTNSIGSIGNVWDSLVKLNQKLLIHIEPISIGTALIYVDTENNTRVSKPNLCLKVKTPKIIKSKWSHVLYLNNIKDLSFIGKITNSIISADVAGKDEFDKSILRYVDYLFISDEDIVDLDELIKITKGYVILHSNSGSVTYSNKKKKIVNSHNVMSGINVLGAGDFFASSFINSMLCSNKLEKSLKIAHQQTIQFLKRNI